MCAFCTFSNIFLIDKCIGRRQKIDRCTVAKTHSILNCNVWIREWTKKIVIVSSTKGLWIEMRTHAAKHSNSPDVIRQLSIWIQNAYVFSCVTVQSFDRFYIVVRHTKFQNRRQFKLRQSIGFGNFVGKFRYFFSVFDVNNSNRNLS